MARWEASGSIERAHPMASNHANKAPRGRSSCGYHVRSGRVDNQYGDLPSCGGKTKSHSGDEDRFCTVPKFSALFGLLQRHSRACSAASSARSGSPNTSLPVSIRPICVGGTSATRSAPSSWPSANVAPASMPRTAVTSWISDGASEMTIPTWRPARRLFLRSFGTLQKDCWD
jgi:hypothetical protein